MANILAVDDNLELCKLIRTTLERDGHRVETRQAGRDLTEALCRWADCILLDVMMPGEDGLPGGRAAGAGSGTSAAAEPHPGAPDGAQRRSL